MEILEHHQPRCPADELPDQVDRSTHPLVSGSIVVTDDVQQVGRRIGLRTLESVEEQLHRPARGAGSAWPASTTVAAGARDTSSCTRRVLPMPASPATSTTVGAEAAPMRPAKRSSSLDRPTMTGDSPVRPTSIPPRLERRDCWRRTGSGQAAVWAGRV